MIFIIASERSGTNLLRTLLNNHSKICAPVAPHLLNAFIPNEQYYGDLNLFENREFLVSQILQLANHPYHNWALELDEKIDFEGQANINVMDVIMKVYAYKSQQEGKSLFCSKGINNILYVDSIVSRYPNAKFIYLHRDPRDHVASWMRTPLFMHTPYQITQKWNHEQDMCIAASKRYQSIYTISYENLISDTSKAMISLLTFLEITPEQECFQTNLENKEAKYNPFWQNLNKPIIKNNQKKYRNVLSSKDVKLIESLSSDNMRQLGYIFDTKANWRKTDEFFFETKERMKTFVSRRMNKSFFQKTMYLLGEKIDLEKSLIKAAIERAHDSSD